MLKNTDGIPALHLVVIRRTATTLELEEEQTDKGAHRLLQTVGKEPIVKLGVTGVTVDL
jgi:hypothetical protein